MTALWRNASQSTPGVLRREVQAASAPPDTGELPARTQASSPLRREKTSPRARCHPLPRQGSWVAIPGQEGGARQTVRLGSPWYIRV